MQGYLKFLLQVCQLAGDYLRSRRLAHLSDKQTLTGSFLYKVSDQDNTNKIKYYDYTVLNARNVNQTISDGDIYSYRIDEEGEDEETLEYSLNYAGNFAKKGQKLTASISYESEVEDENSDFTERLFQGTTAYDDVVDLQKSANKETQNHRTNNI